MQLKINGQNIQCEETGKGQPIIFLHGWMSNSETWNIPTFIKQKYHVILPDLPGHGKTPLGEPMALDDYVKIVKGIIKRLELKRPIIVGHSMGGRIAAKLALKNPDLVKEIVFVSAAGLKSFSISRGIKTGLAKTGKTLTSLLPMPKKAKEDLRKWFYEKIVREEDYLKASKREEYKETFLNLIGEDLTGVYKRLPVPAHIIWGSKDTVLPPAQGEKLDRLISNSKLHIIKEAGHFPFIDQRKPFYQLLDKIASDEPTT